MRGTHGRVAKPALPIFRNPCYIHAIENQEQRIALMETLKNIFNKAAATAYEYRIPQATAIMLATTAVAPLAGTGMAIAAGTAAGHATDVAMGTAYDCHAFENTGMYAAVAGVMIAGAAGVGALPLLAIGLPIGIATTMAGMWLDMIAQIAKGRAEAYMPLDNEVLHVTQENLKPSLLKIGFSAASSALTPPETGVAKAIGMENPGPHSDQMLMALALRHSLHRL